MHLGRLTEARKDFIIKRMGSVIDACIGGPVAGLGVRGGFGFQPSPNKSRRSASDGGDGYSRGQTLVRAKRAKTLALFRPGDFLPTPLEDFFVKGERMVGDELVLSTAVWG